MPSNVVPSNKFLDTIFNGAMGAVEAATSVVEHMLTDATPAASEDGVNPTAKDVLHQLRGKSVDRFFLWVDRVHDILDRVRTPLREVRRIRVDQGYQPDQIPRSAL